MTSTSRDELLTQLVTLGLHYPAMRFGQLMAFACAMAGKPAPGRMEETSDAAAWEAITGHLSKRFGSSGTPIASDLKTLTPARAALVDVLKECGGQYPAVSTGQLLARLAALAHVNVYDAEDEQLVEAGNSTVAGLRWFDWYQDELRQHSTLCDRKDQPTYRCPCCRFLTLYERGGFEICPVCLWEDDGQDDADAGTVRGGPNGLLSLAQARANFLREKVCDPTFRDHVRPARPDEV
jgi:hypothetical protein